MASVKPGYYSLDEQDRLHFSGIPGHNGACGEIVIEKLLEKDGGALERIFGAVTVPRLLEYLPKHQSAFDAMLPAIREEWKNSLTVNPFQNAGADPQAFCYTFETVEFILKLGISNSETKMLELRWAAARGPWPDGDEDFREDQLKPCMQLAYGEVKKLLQKVVASSSSIGDRPEMQYIASVDMECYLSRAWNGIDGWLT